MWTNCMPASNSQWHAGPFCRSASLSIGGTAGLFALEDLSGGLGDVHAAQAVLIEQLVRRARFGVAGQAHELHGARMRFGHYLRDAHAQADRKSTRLNS